MIPVQKHQFSFIYKSFRARYIHYCNPLPEVCDIQYTRVLGYDSYDAIFLSASTWLCVCEFKIRDYNYKFAPLFEKVKFDSLLALPQRNSGTPLYINYWKDGTVSIHNLLRHLNLKSRPINCQANDSGSGWNKKKIFYELPQDADILTRYHYPPEEKILAAFNKKYTIV